MRNVNGVELREVAKSLNKSSDGIIKEARAKSQHHVFLSHSNLDRALPTLAGAVALLERFAATYVDYRDDSLSSIFSDVTTSTLREAIDRSARMVVAASGQIRSSRWVPWEIGYCDGQKGLANIALLPIDEEGHGEIEQEYLQTYPRIGLVSRKGKGEVLRVRDPRDGRCWTMQQWLFEPIV
jgi:hypothetical protein